ncbi:DUF2800 domain-containing protein [Eubacterium pyruvativorans]|uniref:DUF2800 domain-containing protein n=1 Tax=Eubacterium pyruvativorans TaxID=155865 RepID=UPI003F89E215
MEKHEERAHALLSASGAHRWIECTPSAVLESKFPDTTSDAAREGTLAHELCEVKLTHVLYGKDTERAHEWIMQQELYQKEMEEHSDRYVEEIRELEGSFKLKPFIAIESRLDLSAYIPGGFGTGDCIMIGDRKLVIVDFKYGKGVPVYAENNPQLMLYALGAYQKYRMLYNFDVIEMKIVQPRLNLFPDWTCSLDELLAFGETVKEKAAVAIRGEGEFHPGDWCRFCRAKATCRARADYSIQLAFAADKDPALLSYEEVGEYLRKGEHVASWLSDLKEYALRACLEGKEITGWKAVHGRSVRAFDDVDAAFRDAIKAGVEEALLYERRPLTLSKVEKMMGKKAFGETLGSHVVRPPGKPTLVEASDPREAITDTVTPEEAFQ